MRREEPLGRTALGADDEWLYEWTVRVDRESDESFPPAFPQGQGRGGAELEERGNLDARPRPRAVFREGAGTAL